MNPERKSNRPRQDAEEVGVFTGRKEKPIMKLFQNNPRKQPNRDELGRSSQEKQWHQ